MQARVVARLFTKCEPDPKNLSRGQVAAALQLLLLPIAMELVGNREGLIDQRLCLPPQPLRGRDVDQREDHRQPRTEQQHTFGREVAGAVREGRENGIAKRRGSQRAKGDHRPERGELGLQDCTPGDQFRRPPPLPRKLAPRPGTSP